MSEFSLRFEFILKQLQLTIIHFIVWIKKTAKEAKKVFFFFSIKKPTKNNTHKHSFSHLFISIESSALLMFSLSLLLTTFYSWIGFICITFILWYFCLHCFTIHLTETTTKTTTNSKYLIVLLQLFGKRKQKKRFVGTILTHFFLIGNIKEIQTVE